MTQRPWSWCVGPLLLAIAAEAHAKAPSIEFRARRRTPAACASTRVAVPARLNATLYDFDPGGVLREVTYVWARPPGSKS